MSDWLERIIRTKDLSKTLNEELLKGVYWQGYQDATTKTLERYKNAWNNKMRKHKRKLQQERQRRKREE